MGPRRPIDMQNGGSRKPQVASLVPPPPETMNETAPANPAGAFDDGFNHAAEPREVAVIGKYLDWLSCVPGGRILDVGCGDGMAVARLCERGYRATGCDLRPWTWSRGPSWVLSYGGRLPFRNAVFDAVGCLAVLEHLTNPVPFLVELVRVLRPGGRIVVACPNMYGSILLHPGHSVTHRGGIPRYVRNLGLHLRKTVQAAFAPDRVTFDRLAPDLAHIPPGATDYDAVCATDPAVLKAVLRRNGVEILYHSPALEYPTTRGSAAVVRGLDRMPFLRDLFGGIFVVGRRGTQAL